jgi:hypothetical protein
MKRALVSLVVLMLTVTMAQSQIWRAQRIELTAGSGPTQFFGDIGGFTSSENILGFKDISLRQTRFNISVGGNYRIMQDLNIRLNIAYGMFNANDMRGSNVDRAYKSTTNFFETALLGEYYFIKNSAENSYLFSRKKVVRPRTNRMRGPVSGSSLFSKFDIYTFAGIGGLGYSVAGNEALELRDLKDGGFTAIIPAGFGAKFMYTPDISLGFELGGRYAFSDYVEGYSSQYSKYNDMYYFINATFTYKLNTSMMQIFGRR